jgi:hypothetical protein
VRDAVEADRYRLSPRVRRLRRLLEKLTSSPTRRHRHRNADDADGRGRADVARGALQLPEMTRLDLDDDERDELARTLREIIANSRFRLSPRIRCLRRIIDKIEQSNTAPSPAPPTGPTARRR